MVPQPQEIRIHIGAHKTATTHLQDTLATLEMDLRQKNILFLPRHQYRKRIEHAARDYNIERWKFLLLKRLYLSKLLMKGCDRETTLVISEENILGSCINACSIIPYSNHLPVFIKHLSTFISTKIFLSIRGFDRLLPGAYTTALRYNPQKAVKKKRALLADLKQGKTPSWIPLIKRIKNAYPGADLYIWCQEDYAKSPDFYIQCFVGINDIPIPKMAVPSITASPSFSGVHVVEELVSRQDFQREPNWTKQCDSIFQQHLARSSEDKYTFFDKETQVKLKDQYCAELELIKTNWPDSFISRGNGIAR